MSRRTWSLVLGFALAGLGPVPRPSDAQVVSGPLDTARVVADASDVLASARSAQARFERRRIRYLPLNLQPVGGVPIVARVGDLLRELPWVDRAVVSTDHEGIAAEGEKWLGKPVISANAATYWHALRTNGITDQVPGQGTLLEQK